MTTIIAAPQPLTARQYGKLAETIRTSATQLHAMAAALESGGDPDFAGSLRILAALAEAASETARGRQRGALYRGEAP